MTEAAIAIGDIVEVKTYDTNYRGDETGNTYFVGYYAGEEIGYGNVRYKLVAQQKNSKGFQKKHYIDEFSKSEMRKI